MRSIHRNNTSHSRPDYSPTATLPIKRVAGNSETNATPQQALKRSKPPIEINDTPFEPLVIPSTLIKGTTRISSIILESTQACTHTSELQ